MIHLFESNDKWRVSQILLLMSDEYLHFLGEVSIDASVYYKQL